MTDEQLDLAGGYSTLAISRTADIVDQFFEFTR